MPLPKNSKLLELRHVPGYFLLFCISISLYFLFKIFAPFATALVFAMVLAVAFHPVYRFFVRKFRDRKGLASFVTCFVVVLLIVVPFLVLLSLLATEAASVYAFIEQKIRSGVLDEYLIWQQGGYFYDLWHRFFPNLNFADVNFKEQITNSIQTVTNFLVTKSTAILTGITSLILNFLILLVTLYYFFKDGDAIVQKIIQLSPLPTEYEKTIFKKLGDMTNAVLYGTFLTAILQGFLGGLGFAFVGIEQAFLWGTVMAFFSLLPYAGTAIIWVPASIILMVNGEVGSGIFLMIWGVVVVGMSDNFVRPYFIGGKTETYPLLMFLSVLGGIFVYDLSGILFGPVIVTFAITFLEIYRLEYQGILKKLDHQL